MKFPVANRWFVPMALLMQLCLGCATTDTLEKRIESKADLYAGLTPEEQNQIQAGIIRPGFSPDMVFMALGKPERVIPGNGPGAEDWVYHNYYGPDGSSNQMPVVVKTYLPDQGVGSGRDPLAARKSPESSRRGYENTFQVEYDTSSTNLNVKEETRLKVLVKFTEGTVADIQVINDGL